MVRSEPITNRPIRSSDAVGRSYKKAFPHSQDRGSLRARVPNVRMDPREVRKVSHRPILLSYNQGEMTDPDGGTGLGSPPSGSQQLVCRAEEFILDPAKRHSCPSQTADQRR
jgi:hypothetical protein